jgi:hypothetical protein
MVGSGGTTGSRMGFPMTLGGKMDEGSWAAIRQGRMSIRRAGDRMNGSSSLPKKYEF